MITFDFIIRTQEMAIVLEKTGWVKPVQAKSSITQSNLTVRGHKV